MRTLVAAALGAALPLASASAEIITVKYEATLDSPLHVVLSGTYTFDSEATPDELSATHAIYPLLDHRITLNGTLFIGVTNQIEIWNDKNLQGVYGDQYTVRSSTSGSFNGVPFQDSFFIWTQFLMRHQEVR